MAEKKKTGPTYIREIELRYRKRRVKSDAPIHEPLTDPKKIYELFADLQNEAKEKLITISLDAKLKMLCFEVVAVGSVDAIYAKPFEALRTAISVNAHGIIMVHNHPSGNPTPSADDTKFTSHLLVHTLTGGTDFHDHIIIGDGSFYSFAQHGLMSTLKAKVSAELKRLHE